MEGLVFYGCTATDIIKHKNFYDKWSHIQNVPEFSDLNRDYEVRKALGQIEMLDAKIRSLRKGSV